MFDRRSCIGVRYSVAAICTRRRRPRSRRQRRDNQLSAAPGIVRNRPARTPAKSRHRGAPRAAGVGENLRDHYAPRTRWRSEKGHHDERPGARPRHGPSGVPLRPVPQRFPRIRRGADARLRLFARGPGSAGSAPRLGADADRTRPERSEDRPPVGFHLLRSPDAPREQRAHPHHRRGSAPAALDQFQLSVLAARCRIDGARDPDRPRDHDRAGDGPVSDDRIAPGAERTTDEEILDWVKRAAETTYHPVGTCKMGSDPMAVVDAQLRVRGIEGLRIADASIMPTLTSGNTNAPSIMIGEKAAAMVLNAGV